MWRDLVYSYFMVLGLLVATLYTELVQMPTIFNGIWWLALAACLLLAVPVAIYSFFCGDRVLRLLVFVSVLYGGVVLPILLGEQRPILPISVLKVLDWLFVLVWFGVSLHWFACRRKIARKQST
jgi:hypothetical protein